jgi:DNA repair protein RadA/Sms
VARKKTVYRCSECGATAPQWTGWCAACEASGTLVEEAAEPGPGGAGGAGRSPGGVGLLGVPSTPMPIAEAMASGPTAPVPTGFGELDRVLGGGLVPGSVTLVGGEPGIGKSTLLLQALASRAGARATCLYVSAEESARQVALRAERLGLTSPSLWLVAETALPHVLDHLDTVRPDVVVVDSIQTVFDPEASSAPGSVAQVRGCAHRLVAEAKQRATTVVLVGHVTKDGGLAGPRVLEHLVDTVLAFEGERHHALRLLRPVKHRFGSTHELGLFEMGERGLAGVPDPSALFLADRQPGIPGSVVAPVLDGQRPLLVEVQALVVPSNAPMPRRTAQGLDSGRLAQVLAVLERHAGVRLSKAEVHVGVAGGVRVPEPGADLAVALAVASSATERAVAPGVVACGEMGLGGELRQVQRTDRRLAEAARLGFTSAIVPRSAPDPPDGLQVARAGSLRAALLAAGIAQARSRRPPEADPSPSGVPRRGPVGGRSHPERPDPPGGFCPPLRPDGGDRGDPTDRADSPDTSAEVRELLAAAEREAARVARRAAEGDAPRRPDRTLRAVRPVPRNGDGEGGSPSRQ